MLYVLSSRFAAGLQMKLGVLVAVCALELHS